MKGSIEAIDPRGKKIHMKGGESIHFDKALIAWGSEFKTIGKKFSNVY